MLPAAAEESSNVHEDESHSVHDFEEFRGFLEKREHLCVHARYQTATARKQLGAKPHDVRL